MFGDKIFTVFLHRFILLLIKDKCVCFLDDLILSIKKISIMTFLNKLPRSACIKTKGDGSGSHCLKWRHPKMFNSFRLFIFICAEACKMPKKHGFSIMLKKFCIRQVWL